MQEVKSQGKLLPPKLEQPIGEYKEYNTVQKPMIRNQSQDRETWTILLNTVEYEYEYETKYEFLETHCGHLWDLKTPGTLSHRMSHTFVSFISKISPRSLQEIKENNPLVLLLEEEKEHL